MTREMTAILESTETSRELSEATVVPTREIIAGALFVTMHLALWACVSATVLGPVWAVLNLG
jgi:hypothetical protein